MQSEAVVTPPASYTLVQGGADVALNTLTSSGMVAATLATLTPGATFVEISKRDIWSAARVAQGGRSLPCCTHQLPQLLHCLLASDR